MILDILSSNDISISNFIEVKVMAIFRICLTIILGLQMYNVEFKKLIRILSYLVHGTSSSYILCWPIL